MVGLSDAKLPRFNCIAGRECKDLDEAIERAEDNSFRDNYSINLARIKYIAHKIGIKYLTYLYDKLPCSLAENRANRLRDLEGYKYIFSKCNKTYPSDLYSNKDIASAKQLATNLKDLTGIKYIYNRIGLNYINFYHSSGFTDIKALEYAIQIGDQSSAKHFIEKIPTFKTKDLLALLQLSYHKSQLQIAHYLLHHKSIYPNHEKILDMVVPALARVPSIEELSFYQDHINGLANFKQHFTKTLSSLVEAMNNMPSDKSGTLNHYRYDDLPDTLRYIYSFIAINSLTHTKIELLMPSYGSRSYFYAGSLIEPYKDRYIYLSLNMTNDNKQAGAILHEHAHAAFSLLFNNEEKPYYKGGTKREYEKCIEDTLENIFKYAKLDKYYANGQYKKYLALNSWYLKKEGDTENEDKLFQLENLGISGKQENILSLYNFYVKEFNWSGNLPFVLDRIYDYLQKEPHQQHAEFLVLIPELYASRVSENIMQLFAPALAYWGKFITPLIKTYIEQHFEDCTNAIKQNSNHCIWHVFSKEQRLTLIDLAVEVSCLQCIESIYDAKILTSEVRNKVRETILPKAAHKLANCVKYCKEISQPQKNSNLQCESILTLEPQCEMSYQIVEKRTECSYIPPAGYLQQAAWLLGDLLYDCAIIGEAGIKGTYADIVTSLYEAI
jgi:hypothetical protein